MTTKKIVIIVVSIALVIGLIGVVFVAGIIGVVFYSIGSSAAAETARSFLQSSEPLKGDIGDVKDFGSFVTGSVNVNNNNGNATINLKVVGDRKTVNASVDLIYRNGQPWRVTRASYLNDKGETVELVDPSQGRSPLPRTILKVAA